MSPANQSTTTSTTPAGKTNGRSIESELRAARVWLDRHKVTMSQSKLSRLLRGYDAESHGAVEHALSQWLQSGRFDPTGDTASYRADSSRQARIGCPCGCLTSNECRSQSSPRMTPGSGCACATVGIEYLRQGIGCEAHTLNTAVSQ